MPPSASTRHLRLPTAAALPLAIVGTVVGALVTALVVTGPVSVAATTGGGVSAPRGAQLVLRVAPGSSTSAVLARRASTKHTTASFQVPHDFGRQLSVGLVVLSSNGGGGGFALEARVRNDGRVTAVISRTSRPGRPLASRVLPLLARPDTIVRLEAGIMGAARPRLALRAWSGETRPGWQVRTSTAARQRVPSHATVYVRASLGQDAPLPVAVTVDPDPATSPPDSPVPTTAPDPGPTVPPSTPTLPTTPATDQWGPVGRSLTTADLGALGWDGVQEPRPDSVTVVDPEVELGANRPAGPILRSELRVGELAETGGHRAEVYGRRPAPWNTVAAGWDDPPGSERWYSFSVFVPEGLPVATDTTWLTFTQWKGFQGGSPPIALEIKRSGLRLGGTRTNAGLIPHDGSLGPIAFGEWTHLTVGIHFSPDPAEGWVEAYRDGIKKVDRTSVSTMDTVAGEVDPIYLKQGIYRSLLWKSTQVLFFSPTTVSEVSPYAS